MWIRASNAEACWRLNGRPSRRLRKASSSRFLRRDLVPGQLDHRHVERVQRRGGVEVSAFLGLAVQGGPSAFELGELAQSAAGPRGRSCAPCLAPRRRPCNGSRNSPSAWSSEAQAAFHRPNRSELIPRTSSTMPIAVRRADSVGERRRRLPAASATRVIAGKPDVDRCAASMAMARAMRDGSPARSASKSPRVWKSAPRIGSIMLRPATADQQRSMRVSSMGGTCASSRSRNRRPRIRRRTRCQSSDSEGPPRRLGHAHAQRGEQGAQQCQALVDMAADQELGRRQPLELEGLGRRGRRGRRQIGLRRLGTPAGVGQRVAQPAPEAADLGGGPGWSSSAIRYSRAA